MSREPAKKGGGRLTGATFGERLADLKGDRSYHELARQMQAKGLKVTAQGLHKWIAGGGISVENLKDVAAFFGRSPAWLYFGEEDEQPSQKLDDKLSRDAWLVGKAWSLLPERYRVPLAMDIYKLAQNQIDENSDPRLHFEIKQALKRAVEELTKGV